MFMLKQKSSAAVRIIFAFEGKLLLTKNILLSSGKK